MHIVYIAQYFNLPSEAGGSRVYQFAKRWVARGHRVTLVTSFLNQKTMRVPRRYRGKLWCRENVEGIDLLRVYSYANIRGSFSRRIVNFLSFALFASLFGVFKAKRPDIVYATSTPLTTGIPGLFLSFLKRAPLVFEVRDLWPQSAVVAGVLHKGALVRFTDWFARYVYTRSRKIVALTQGIANGIIDTGVSPDKVKFAPNGVDDWITDNEVSPKARQELDLDGKFVCIYVGAHGIWNNLGTMLEAAEMLRHESEFKFIFVGDGDDKPRLQRMVRAKNLSNILFLDPVSKRDAMAHVKMADCCLITAGKHPFQRMIFPNKLFDYMGCGRPTVVAAEGEMADMVLRSGAGLAVPPEEPTELAAALRQLAKFPQGKREMMGSQAREYVLAYYKRDDIADTLLEEFSRLV
jgi:glycosyltransferase involved in cell wall biosynthesis